MSKRNAVGVPMNVAEFIRSNYEVWLMERRTLHLSERQALSAIAAILHCLEVSRKHRQRKRARRWWGGR